MRRYRGWIWLVCITGMLCGVIGFMVGRGESMDDLAARVHRTGAVLVDKASIEWNLPPGRAVVRNQTLRMSNPVIVRELPSGRPRYTIVVPREATLVRQVEVVMDTLKTIGPGDNPILPEEVEIVAVNAGGKPVVKGRGRINYIEIVPGSARDTAPH